LAGQSEGKVLGDERNKDYHSSTACVPLPNSYEIGRVAKAKLTGTAKGRSISVSHRWQKRRSAATK
jgi:hypothetical protein